MAGSIIITRRIHHPLVKGRTYEPYGQVVHMQYGSGSLGDSMRILYRIKTCDVKLRDLIGMRLAFGHMLHNSLQASCLKDPFLMSNAHGPYQRTQQLSFDNPMDLS